MKIRNKPIFLSIIQLFGILLINSDRLKAENYNPKIDLIWKKVIKQDDNKNKENIIWEKLDKDSIENYFFSDDHIDTNDKLNIGKLESKVNSLNRSIVLNKYLFTPDVAFIVPLGFKSNESKWDFSVRGWNRRPANSKFFAWNNGDAVAHVNYQLLHNNDYSFGLNLGVRSLYYDSNSDVSGGSTKFGEGLSAGFRWDYALSNKSGIAIGAEQLIDFDGKTDTGRDIYLTTSRAWFGKQDSLFPVYIATAGIGTGYFALQEETQFACTDLFGGASVDINKYHQLCWGPFGTVSTVFNENFSAFFEYNNYSFMIGSSIRPLKKARITFGATIAESFDDYNIKNLNEIRWFSRISLSI